MTLALAAACAEPTPSGVTRETLPNGAVLVRYTALSDVPSTTLAPDLRIGALDGEPWETFGFIRALEAGPDGTIYVLDSQAEEVRVFAPDGSFVKTLARRGEGPGEIREANGMALGPEGVLWVQDYGAWAIVGLSKGEGREVARHPMIVPGYGGTWDGSVDDRGVIRQTWSYSDGSAREDGFGLQEIGRRLYAKSYDPRTQRYDSIFLSEGPQRFLRIDQGGGWTMSTGVPLDPRPLTALDRNGATWIGYTDRYRVTRVDRSGDTTLVLRTDVEGRPVSEKERDLISSLSRQAGVDLPVPDHGPIVERLYADDRGRLWVKRARPSGKPRRFDVYDAEGEFLLSLELPSDIVDPLIVRGDHIYAVARDELDVSYVVRARVPPLPRY